MLVIEIFATKALYWILFVSKTCTLNTCIFVGWAGVPILSELVSLVKLLIVEHLAFFLESRLFVCFILFQLFFFFLLYEFVYFVHWELGDDKSEYEVTEEDSSSAFGIWLKLSPHFLHVLKVKVPEFEKDFFLAHLRRRLFDDLIEVDCLALYLDFFTFFVFYDNLFNGHFLTVTFWLLYFLFLVNVDLAYELLELSKKFLQLGDRLQRLNFFLK